AAAAVPYGFGAAKEVVRMLLDAGAEVNAQGGYYGNALQAAAAASDGSGAKEVVRMLLDAGAEKQPPSPPNHLCGC
ncbi:hypothetical protein FGG08_006646, partial [Glutinoglossum americanum]